MIKADVKYTIEHFKALRADVMPLKQRIIWLVTTAATTAFAVFCVLTGKNFFNLFTVLAIPLWGVTLFYIILYYILLNPKKMLKKYNETQPDSHIIFEFSDISLKITNESRMTNGVNEHRYEMLEFAWENGDFFVIQIKNIGQVAIRSSEIIEGTPEELRQLLKDKLGENFIEK